MKGKEEAGRRTGEIAKASLSMRLGAVSGKSSQLELLNMYVCEVELFDKGKPVGGGGGS